MATLVVIEGPASGQQFALGDHRIVMIGRDDECTFQILDQQMSRRHMQIKLDDETGGHLLVDAGSANGVVANGTRIEQATLLADGDEIRVGETCMVYATADSPDASSIDSLLRKRGERRRSTLVRDPDEV